MIELIMAAFVDMLESEDWLTERTKGFAKEKVFKSFFVKKKKMIFRI